MKSLRSHGFTLIELMLVLTMIVVLFGGSITAYLTFNKNQTTKNDARNFVAEIYRVRTLASSLQYPTGCSSLKGYNLQSTLVNGDLAGVTLTADCDPSDVASAVLPVLTNSYFSGAVNLTFLPGSGYLGGGANTDVTIVNKSDPTITKVVTVGAYGVVTSN